MGRKKIKIGGILKRRGLAQISILSAPDRQDVLASVFEALGTSGINTSFIVQTTDPNNLDTIVLAVARAELAVALEALRDIRDGVCARELLSVKEVAMISVFGPHFGEEPGIAGVMFTAMASAGIPILAVSTSISSLSCLIEEEGMEKALTAVENAFELP
ncbi:MAG: ACT domain-containing protein [Deltaproteobacteria bacterium]|nr:ACT domain-containing protein [Deltaproteobacteria bacterium]